VITSVRPDVYVKSGDYAGQILAEQAVIQSLGGRVEALDHIAARSASDIIARAAGGF
jgi:bifunctional ADP-heptose synthase (sugar kinase/adenylyltransferase)